VLSLVILTQTPLHSIRAIVVCDVPGDAKLADILGLHLFRPGGSPRLAELFASDYPVLYAALTVLDFAEARFARAPNIDQLFVASGYSVDQIDASTVAAWSITGPGQAVMISENKLTSI